MQLRDLWRLSAHLLASASSVEMKKELLGECLYPLVNWMYRKNGSRDHGNFAEI